MACVFLPTFCHFFLFILFLFFYWTTDPLQSRERGMNKSRPKQGNWERSWCRKKQKDSKKSPKRYIIHLSYQCNWFFFLLTGKIHFFKEHCWQLIFLLCTVHALSEYHCLKGFVRSGTGLGFMFALMILVGISEYVVYVLCVFAHCNLDLLMESCNFEICI